MSRMSSESNVIAVPRTSNIYTALAAVGLIVVILSLVVVWNKADTLFGGLLTEQAPPAAGMAR